MRVFKGKQFSRWAAGEAVGDADLCQAAAEAFAGQYEADLGGYLFKKRIARQDGGKSGGYRTILGFRKSDSQRIFFLYGFPKKRPGEHHHEGAERPRRDRNGPGGCGGPANRRVESQRNDPGIGVRKMSEILDMAHDMAKDLHAVGAMDAITMRMMDELCLPKKRTFTAAEIRRIRSRTRMSQPIFAVMVGVGASTVAQWEQGNKKPSGASARLLDVIDRKGIEAIA